jgi:hypothetical protein
MFFAREEVFGGRRLASLTVAEWQSELGSICNIALFSHLDGEPSTRPRVLSLIFSFQKLLQAPEKNVPFVEVVASAGLEFVLA